MTRGPSPTTELIRLGFADVRRATSLLEDPALTKVLAKAEEAGTPLLPALGNVADPDAALLLLIRLLEAAQAKSAACARAVTAVLAGDSPQRERLLAVLGASTALGDLLVARPELVDRLAYDPQQTAVLALTPEDERRIALLTVGVDELGECLPATIRSPEGADVVRRVYRERVLHIAAADLTAPDPLAVFPEVAAALADAAGAALDAALAVARADALAEGVDGADVRLAIIGMGKVGGRELNYVSDVDVLFVVAPTEGMDEDTALTAGTWLAQRTTRVLNGTGGNEPALWTVDANLRPEGKDGPLVRTVDSYRSYYKRWAHNWEFQALLKARHLAGDDALGAEFLELTRPLVWAAAGQENFVADAQEMRRRVESLLPAREADRELKLGRGGLRDVEFTVQLLQLVHGRTDETVRARGTLAGLAQLMDGGYVGRDAAATMGHHYRFVRALEHRIQLHRMRRTHLLPTAEKDLRRLSRALCGAPAMNGKPMVDGTADSLAAAWRRVRIDVRLLHEQIFYRPLLPLTAQLSPDDVSLTPQAAHARLAAIGYLAPERAGQQIRALTEGISRRAAIQKQVLPVMLGWFADGPDPDGGLLSFRKLSERLGNTHWYMKLLRDSGTAGQQLAHALSHSEYVAREIPEIPDAVQWLDEDSDLAPRDADALRAELTSIVSRRKSSNEAIDAVRYLRRRELLRAALGDTLHGVDPTRARTILTPVNDLALEGALAIAEREVLVEAGRDPGEPLARFLLVAMGRTGGREVGYASDADVLFVYEPVGAVGEGRGRVRDTGRDSERDAGGAAGVGATSVGRGAGGAIGVPGAAGGHSDGAVGRRGSVVSSSDAEQAAALAEHALAVATRVRSLLTQGSTQPPFPVDADLRPEGRQGPLIRSLDSYLEYYERWAQAWERQALLRARPAAGDADLAARFMRHVDAIRYPEGGFSAADLREIRRIKARIETERMPRGADPKRHLKLGRGSLSDVEWTAQILQAQYAGDEPALRVTGTVETLMAARDAELISVFDADTLMEAWLLATRVRAAIVLATGRVSGAKLDLLPHDVRELEMVARLLGYAPRRRLDLEEDYLRATRRARAVMERIFYG